MTDTQLNRAERRRRTALTAHGLSDDEIKEIPRRRRAPRPPPIVDAAHGPLPDYSRVVAGHGPQPPPTVIGDPLLDSRGVCAQIGGVSLMTLWRLIKFRGFPGPDIQLGQRRRFWRLSTVDRWIEQQVVGTTETREAEQHTE